MKTGTENRVNHKVGLFDELDKFITRRPDMNRNVTTRRAPCDMTSKGAGNLIGINRGHNVNIDTLLAQNISCNPTISPVITETAEYKKSLRGTSLNKTGDKLTSQLHKLGLRGPLFLNKVFQATDLFSI